MQNNLRLKLLAIHRVHRPKMTVIHCVPLIRTGHDDYQKYILAF